MRIREFFPLGIATAEAFCNRTEETKLLLSNIQNGKHTLLMAPRRYGKSSLALHVLELSKQPYAEIDFYMARNEKIIESYILNGIIELIGKSFGSAEKLIATIKKHVKHLKPKLNIGTNQVKLELTSSIESDPATNVKEALSLLEHLLAEKDKYAVLLLDEFQNVGVIAKGTGIEGAIRHVAQKTKHLSIIFSGSNRKLLKTMFDDDIRPLYKLCWQLTLSRISETHYKKHLEDAAQLYWKSSIDEKAFETIMSLTEKHPYYVNKLCDRLWTYYDKSPTAQEVFQTWQSILDEEKSDAVKELATLSIGQKNVLVHIAKGNIENITGHQTIMELQMSSSSIVAAIDGLDEKDIIEKRDNTYHIINPVIKYYALK